MMYQNYPFVPRPGNICIYERKKFRVRSSTDWKRLARLDDLDVDTSDIPEARDEFFHRAKLSLGGRDVTAAEIVTLRLEPELAAWVRSVISTRLPEIETALKRLREELHATKS